MAPFAFLPCLRRRKEGQVSELHVGLYPIHYHQLRCISESFRPPTNWMLITSHQSQLEMSYSCLRSSQHCCLQELRSGGQKGGCDPHIPPWTTHSIPYSNIPSLQSKTFRKQERRKEQNAVASRKKQAQRKQSKCNIVQQLLLIPS